MAAEDDLYDEFGNYIGPDLDDSDDSGADSGAEENDAWLDNLRPAADADANGGGGGGGGGGDGDGDDAAAPMAVDGADAVAMSADEAVPVDVEARAIVLHEDKKYYPSAKEVFGDAETLVQDEDTQPLTQPIIEPLKQRTFDATEDEFSATSFTRAFMTDLAQHHERVRNIAVIGHLHHGKTNLLDMLVHQTHLSKKWRHDKPIRYTDTRQDEQDRGMSIKCTPMSFVLPSSADRSYLFNVLDTPGHIDFGDEVSAALRLADGAVVVVDVVEGVLVQTERLLKHALAEGVDIVLVLNKLDRLIVELKLPPADAFFKIRQVLHQVNDVLGVASTGADWTRLSPTNGNVVFASTMYGWCFTVDTFAALYASLFDVEADKLARRFWGDVFYDETTRKFTRKPAPGRGAESRTFVSFILEPLYKIHTAILGEAPQDVEATLGTLGVYLKKEQYRMDVQPLLRLVFSRVFPKATALADAVVAHVRTPRANAVRKVERVYTGPQDADVTSAMLRCDAAGPLMMYVCKIYPAPNQGDEFDCLCRVMSGTVTAGQEVTVLGEEYAPGDEEDAVVRTVTGLWVLQARYKVAVPSAGAGSIVLVRGVSDSLVKTGTITGVDARCREAHVFRPLAFPMQAVVKLAVEPLNPQDLPKMLDGLRKINKTYPLCTTRVEESGEHVIVGTGEMYLDCVMHDLRQVYAEVEIKVADPVVTFAETVVDTSAIKCFAETPNRQNRLTFIAEPLDKGLAEDIERGMLPLQEHPARVRRFLQESYGWDLLAAKSVWAVGPSGATGPNVLQDDTVIEGDAELRRMLKQGRGDVRQSIVQGFQWATKEGPLCEEPIRNVKFKLLDAVIARDAVQRGRHLIPTARRAAYSSFLMATPRLMEPVFYVDIQTPADSVAAVYKVLSQRRGHVTSDAPIAGTPLYQVKAFVPVIDSFGFETDLRMHTLGQAFCCQVFDHWAIVPGDPLDKSIVLRPLERSPPPHLAREFMLKTRRRKGLAEEVSINRFFDAPMMEELAKLDSFMM